MRVAKPCETAIGVWGYLMVACRPSCAAEGGDLRLWCRTPVACGTNPALRSPFRTLGKRTRPNISVRIRGGSLCPGLLFPAPDSHLPLVAKKRSQKCAPDLAHVENRWKINRGLCATNCILFEDYANQRPFSFPHRNATGAVSAGIDNFFTGRLKSNCIVPSIAGPRVVGRRETGGIGGLHRVTNSPAASTSFWLRQQLTIKICPVSAADWSHHVLACRQSSFTIE